MDLKGLFGVFEFHLELIQAPLEHVLPPVALLELFLELGVRLVDGINLGAQLHLGLGFVLFLGLSIDLFLLKLLDPSAIQLLNDLELADARLETSIRGQELLMGLWHVEAVAVQRRRGATIRSGETRELLGLELIIYVLIYRGHVRRVKVGRPSPGYGRVAVVDTVRGSLRGLAGIESRCASSIGGIGKICSVQVARGWEVGMSLCLLLCLAPGQLWAGYGLRSENEFTFFCLARSGRILTRLRLLITSVLSEMGRGRPWSLRNRPQALQRTAPVSSRLHSGVVDVPQF